MIKKKIKLESVTTEFISSLFSIILDHKGMNTIHYSGMQNYLCSDAIISTVMSKRHGETIAEHIAKYLKENNIYFNSSLNDKAENVATDWIVIDCLRIMIHIMIPQKREYYNIDNMMYEVNGEKISAQKEEKVSEEEVYTIDHVTTKDS